jgi:hypothetical protein
MHFTTLLLACLSTTTLALPLPTGATIAQDVRNIDTAVRALDATVQAYKGVPLPVSLVEGAPVLAGVAEIHRVNRAGFVHALAAQTFSVEESVNVVDVVSGTGESLKKQDEKVDADTSGVVNKSIPAATAHIKAKVAAFKEGGLVPVVIASLTLLLSDHDTFSAAVLAKFNPGTPPDKVSEGSEAIANIHNVIQDAIVFYTANLV